ncbi:MAG: hypothetical protein LIO43_05860, partial [Clostridiales bacterium]|nr:hypothetical protein [Clostridiales bacterium]
DGDGYELCTYIKNKNNNISFENIKKTREKREQRQKNATSLSGNTLKVYRALSNEFLHVDEIKAKTSLSIGDVLTALTALEIADLAESAGGKRYKLS